jgi:hypothetical protein
MKRLLLAFHDAPPPATPGELVFLLQPGLGGAWSEFAAGVETIRFGFPESSRSRRFRLLEDPGPRSYNLLTIALERIAFSRSLTEVHYADPRLAIPVRVGLRRHPHILQRRVVW